MSAALRMYAGITGITTHLEPVMRRNEAESQIQKVAIKTHTTALEALIAIVRFALLVVPAALLTLLTRGRWNLLTHEISVLHRSFHLSNKAVYNAVQEITQDLFNNRIMYYQAIQQLDLAKKRLIEQCSTGIHTAEAETYLEQIKGIIDQNFSPMQPSPELNESFMPRYSFSSSSSDEDESPETI